MTKIEAITIIAEALRTRGIRPEPHGQLPYSLGAAGLNIIQALEIIRTETGMYSNLSDALATFLYPRGLETVVETHHRRVILVAETIHRSLQAYKLLVG